MAGNPAASPLLEILRDTVVDLVRRDTSDLTSRQFAVLLVCYLDRDSTNTVRGLSAKLNVAKPAITQAIDRLEQEQWAVRKQEPRDRRSILVGQTSQGAVFMKDLSRVMDRAQARVAGSQANITITAA